MSDFCRTFNLISRERLRNILNIIEQSPAGKNILFVLKELLKNNAIIKSICFQSHNEIDGAKQWLACYYSEPKEELFKIKSFFNSELLINYHQNIKNPEWWHHFNADNIENFVNELKQYADFSSKTALISKTNKYDFDYTMAQKTKKLCVNINENPLFFERFVFDGENIIIQDIRQMLKSKEALEAYLVAHELVHCIQFLSNENNVMKGKEDKDWKDFFQTDRMHPIYNALHGKYSDKEIYNAFKNLFTNVEEARNLLGFVPEGSSIPIGEFFLFNEQEKFLLPTYLTEDRKLTDIEKAVLNTIAKELNVHLQNVVTT